MSKKRNLSEVMKAIDWKFKKMSFETYGTSKDILIQTSILVKNKVLSFKIVDTENGLELDEFAKILFQDYIKRCPENNIHAFKDSEIRWAVEHQSSFWDYTSDVDHNKYYYILQNWIDFLNKWNPKRPGQRNMNIKYDYPKIALIYAYEKPILSHDNKDFIAAKHNLPSGNKLYIEYLKYSRTSSRIGEPEPPTKTKFKNKIRLLESVTDGLSPKAKAKNLDEITLLKAKYKESHP